MAVSQGRKGKITVRTTAGAVTVAEMGSWSVSGQQRDMIEHTAFQDSVKDFKPGMLDAGSISMSGFYDNSDSSGQKKLLSAFSSGVGISNSSAYKLRKMRLWANTSTAFGPKGFWSCTGSSGTIYLTGVDLGQDKSGLGTISITGKVSGGILAFTSST